ncbi:cysteine synthase A [Caldithrix abyssi DSM 13497]|uniref:Cysteine synthase n=1 Tax=Caldithrix abyssi DSM 13497 TaxID=880073 RepID=H1XNH4_CALAY|nr:cysteine synthase A [Caldithrix abyssi]APF18108.1 cysteine synthase [Caldithrix abyssi DSM 13497]EHO42145.1 cysteine synthase A [Caldithrix abyssi DSM 13497]
MKLNHILEQIGNTPHVRINRLFDRRHEVWLKLERTNPGGSIKDRIALSMIEDAEQKGILKKDSVIVEPTSGNTGVGLAMVAAVKGYRIILVMPESMSMERRSLMAAYGAEFELTPKEQGMKGAIERAKELAAKLPNAWMPMQFENPANVEAHKKFTAQEILQDFPDGLDWLITGVGTGGHITGVAEILKKEWPHLKVFAVEPDQSPVLSGGQPGSHPIQGIGAGFIPAIMKTDLLDDVIQISKEEAFRFAQQAARQEGILVGISTGASLAAVAQKLETSKEPKKVLTFNYDTGERYLSVADLFV